MNYQDQRLDQSSGLKRKQSAPFRLSLLQPRKFFGAIKQTVEIFENRRLRTLASARWAGLGLLLLAAMAPAQAPAQSFVTLAWNAVTNSAVSGYRIYRGTASRVYSSVTDVGNVTEATVSGLTPGAADFFALCAYSPSGIESDCSSEIKYTVPAAAGNAAADGPPPVSDLPDPWLTAGLGSVSHAGTASVFKGNYAVVGAGNISGSSDNFRFVYQPLTRDGEISACISSTESTGVKRCVGIMFRETLASSSRHMFMGLSPTGTFIAKWRNATRGLTGAVTSRAGSGPRFWVRLTRSANIIRAYKSGDGVKWTLVMAQRIPMAQSAYLGLAVASGSATVLNTSVFNNVVAVP